MKPLIQVTIVKPSQPVRKPVHRKRVKRRTNPKQQEQIKIALSQLVVPAIVIVSVAFWIWQMMTP